MTMQGPREDLTTITATITSHDNNYYDLEPQELLRNMSCSQDFAQNHE